MLPTDHDVATYHARGYWVSPVILPDAVLDAALRGQERFYAGDVDAPFPGRTRYDDYDWTPAHGDGLRKNDYASLMVEELGALVGHPLIGAIAARLSGADGVRLWHDQLLYKPADTGDANVGWHADRQYWGTCSSQDMLTAWAPLHDVDEAMGTITFVEGSHRWEGTVEGLDFFTDDFAAQSARLVERAGDAIVPATMRRGQVSFHHCKTIHGSGANRSDGPRRSVAIHMQPADNHHVGVSYHRNDDLVRRVDGRPDYADPRICPVLA